jgi:membrane associated rhomboid family serine protease
VLPPSQQPALRLHSAVVVFIALLIAIYVLPPLIFSDWGGWSSYWLAFIPMRFSAGQQFPQAAGSAYWTMITHALLHGSTAHLAANSLWLVVFGTSLARVVGTFRFVLISVVAAIAGALATLFVNWGEFIILVGASGAISGMLGALIPVMFADDGMRNIRGEISPTLLAVLPAARLLNDLRALAFMANFLIFTFVTGAAQSLMSASFAGAANIAWEAHLGGFLAGLLTIYLLAPRSVPSGG